MELTRISEWFGGISDYPPSVGSEVILMPLLVRDGWLVLRFLDHLGVGIDLELCSNDLHRIIVFVKTQRALKTFNGGKDIIAQKENQLNFLNHYTNLPCGKTQIPKKKEQPPKDGKVSTLTEWFVNDGTYKPEKENAVLTDIFCKVSRGDRLSASLINSETRKQEFYLLHFQVPEGNDLEILLSRIDVNRIIYFEESRQSLKLRETL